MLVVVGVKDHQSLHSDVVGDAVDKDAVLQHNHQPSQRINCCLLPLIRGAQSKDGRAKLQLYDEPRRLLVKEHDLVGRESGPVAAADQGDNVGPVQQLDFPNSAPIVVLYASIHDKNARPF